MAIQAIMPAAPASDTTAVAVFETEEQRKDRLCFEQMEAKAKFEDSFIRPRKEDMALQPVIPRKKVFQPRHHA